jgi:Ca2+-binding RTX toxin-like protein
MATPSTSDFLNAANYAYGRDATPPTGLTQFTTADGRPFELRDNATGFFGTALQTTDGSIIVAFEGTDLGDFEDNPQFVVAQVLADFAIYQGQLPATHLQAADFARSVVAAAGANPVYLSGHSLGGGEALYAAAVTGLGGQTYGAPGIPTTAIPAGSVLGLTNYVEYGDPVGNYSFTPTNVLGDFLYSDQIVRFGDPTYVGDPLDALELIAAGQAFAPGTSDEVRLAGLAVLANNFATIHPLTVYAGDLGVTISGDPAGGFDDLSLADVQAILTSIRQDGIPVSGGTGADALTGSAANDAVRGGAGNDTLSGQAGDDKLFAGSGDDQAFGQDGNDSVLGGAGNDFASGGFGADTVLGEAGNDLVFGDDDDDLVDGGDGDDLVYGGSGTDAVYGSAGIDQVYGQDGNDFVGAGDDFGSGGFGNDEVHGEEGNDLLFGDEGDDGVYGEDGDDLVYGGTGNDYLTGDAGNDLVRGEDGDDRLSGGDGDDDLSGGAGADTLVGGAGADLLFGNTGNDVLTGDMGADVFAFGAGDGMDRILDFVTGGSEADVIAFNGGVFADFAAVQAASRQEGADVVIAYGAGDALTLAGVQVGSLSAANFAFA